MRVFILMSGDNKRFADNGYTTHKSMLPIFIDDSINTLDHILLELEHMNTFIFVDEINIILRPALSNSLKCSQNKSIFDFIKGHKLSSKINILYDSPLKAGALYSFYNGLIAVENNIKKDFPIMIVNCDQVCTFDYPALYNNITKFKSLSNIGGIIIHCDKELVDEKYHNLFGYSVVDSNNKITHIQEKDSKNTNYLHTGYYIIKNFNIAINLCASVFNNNARLSYLDSNKNTINTNEFFISQIFEKMICEGLNIVADNSVIEYVSVGTPELYQNYIINHFK